MIKLIIAGCYTFFTTWLFMDGFNGYSIHWIVPVILSGTIAFEYWYDFITENKGGEAS